MSETDAFLDTTMARYRDAETALHNGDATARKAMWARTDPVTLLGAALSATGWAQIEPIFDQLAARFSTCTTCQHEVIAAGASGDLAYLVALEHTAASINDSPQPAYTLRATTVFRREDGEWKVAHRHADPVTSANATELVSRLTASDPENPRHDVGLAQPSTTRPAERACP